MWFVCSYSQFPKTIYINNVDTLLFCFSMMHRSTKTQMLSNYEKVKKNPWILAKTKVFNMSQVIKLPEEILVVGFNKEILTLCHLL